MLDTSSPRACRPHRSGDVWAGESSRCPRELTGRFLLLSWAIRIRWLAFLLWLGVLLVFRPVQQL